MIGEKLEVLIDWRLTHRYSYYGLGDKDYERN